MSERTGDAGVKYLSWALLAWHDERLRLPMVNRAITATVAPEAR